MHAINNKADPMQDETYLGLNSLDQAVLISDSNDIDVYFFNESHSLVDIGSNCIISSILIPEHHGAVIDMNSVLTIVVM